MSSTELGYFPDLKKFIKFIKNYIILLIVSILICLSFGYYRYYEDQKKLISFDTSQIKITKKTNINQDNYDFALEEYNIKSQVKPITNYLDINNYVFNKITNTIMENLQSRNIKYKHIYQEGNSIFTINNFKISENYDKEIYDIFFKSFGIYLSKYKEIEYYKFNKKVSQFLFDIAVDGNFPSVLIDNNLNDTNDENKLNYLEDTFSQLFERGITQVPESIFDDLFLQDTEYKTKFIKSIKYYLIQNCISLKNNDFFCDYVKMNFSDTELIPSSGEEACELASNLMDYKRVLLSILDSKTECYNGFKHSKEIIFEPLTKFLETISFYEGFYSINIKILSEKNQISLLVYLAYSFIFAIFIFIIFSISHSIYSNFK